MLCSLIITYLTAEFVSLSLWFYNLNCYSPLPVELRFQNKNITFMNNTERSFDRFSFFDLLSITQASSDKKKGDSKNEETGRKQSLKKSFSDALKKSSEEMEEKKLRYIKNL